LYSEGIRKARKKGRYKTKTVGARRRDDKMTRSQIDEMVLDGGLRSRERTWL
jgi:hypothetical protein